jgi:6-pyruvoyltetrahydropterin/6-carboxytetrahydropterin synthase
MPHPYEIRIRKEALKFASSHMTVFPDGTKETLHGHGYMPTVFLRLEDASFENMIPFARIKEEMKRVALEWDEKVLIAVLNPFYRELSRKDGELEFRLCGKRYILPLDEVVLLEIDNVTCECLARVYHERIKGALAPVRTSAGIGSLGVLIEESPGQGAVYSGDL